MLAGKIAHRGKTVGWPGMERFRFRERSSITVCSAKVAVGGSNRSQEHRMTQQPQTAPLYLGIDVGSVSINLALVRPDRSVAWTRYLRHFGRSMQVVREALESLLADDRGSDVVREDDVSDRRATHDLELVPQVAGHEVGAFLDAVGAIHQVEAQVLEGHPLDPKLLERGAVQRDVGQAVAAQFALVAQETGDILADHVVPQVGREDAIVLRLADVMLARGRRAKRGLVELLFGEVPRRRVQGVPDTSEAVALDLLRLKSTVGVLDAVHSAPPEHAQVLTAHHGPDLACGRGKVLVLDERHTVVRAALQNGKEPLAHRKSVRMFSTGHQTLYVVSELGYSEASEVIRFLPGQALP